MASLKQISNIRNSLTKVKNQKEVSTGRDNSSTIEGNYLKYLNQSRESSTDHRHPNYQNNTSMVSYSLYSPPKINSNSSEKPTLNMSETFDTKLIPKGKQSPFRSKSIGHDNMRYCLKEEGIINSTLNAKDNLIHKLEGILREKENYINYLTLKLDKATDDNSKLKERLAKLDRISSVKCEINMLTKKLLERDETIDQQKRNFQLVDQDFKHLIAYMNGKILELESLNNLNQKKILDLETNLQKEMDVVRVLKCQIEEKTNENIQKGNIIANINAQILAFKELFSKYKNSSERTFYIHSMIKSKLANLSEEVSKPQEKK